MTHTPKNQIGAFFFYLNEQTARNVASVAKEKPQFQGRCSTCTITSCVLTADVNLLDLRCQGQSVKILDILYRNDIDVLTGQFTHKGIAFSKIRNNYSMLSIATPMAILRRMIDEEAIRSFFRVGRRSMLGQLLTDFANGYVFKDILLNKGFEGYIFDEEQSSPTICILYSSKLSEPQHTVIM